MNMANKSENLVTGRMAMTVEKEGMEGASKDLRFRSWHPLIPYTATKLQASIAGNVRNDLTIDDRIRTTVGDSDSGPWVLSSPLPPPPPPPPPTQKKKKKKKKKKKTKKSYITQGMMSEFRSAAHLKQYIYSAKRTTFKLKCLGRSWIFRGKSKKCGCYGQR